MLLIYKGRSKTTSWIQNNINISTISILKDIFTMLYELPIQSPEWILTKINQSCRFCSSFRNRCLPKTRDEIFWFFHKLQHIYNPLGAKRLSVLKRISTLTSSALTPLFNCSTDRKIAFGTVINQNIKSL